MEITPENTKIPRLWKFVEYSAIIFPEVKFEMNITLTIQEKLKDLRIEKGLTLEQLAEQTGISKSALGKYESDDYKDISPFNLAALAKFYSVSSDYLLGLSEQKNHPNTELQELHLSDNMLDLLKSNKINNRLLCEIATHENFIRLLTDIEIYVDRIASMQIDNLNAVVELARTKVLEKNNLDKNELYLRTLEVSHIAEDDYFSHLVHQDIDCIIKDIREQHKNDSATAPDSSYVDDFKKVFDEVNNFKGSEQEKKARLFCKQLSIDYDKLSTEEYVNLIHILEKSSLVKSNNNLRGKFTHGKGKRKR